MKKNRLPYFHVLTTFCYNNKEFFFFFSFPLFMFFFFQKGLKKKEEGGVVGRGKEKRKKKKMDENFLLDTQTKLADAFTMPKSSEKEMFDNIVHWIGLAKKDVDWRVGSYAVKAAKEGGLIGCFDVLDILLSRIKDKELKYKGQKLMKELSQFPIAADDNHKNTMKYASCVVDGRKQNVHMGTQTDMAALVGYIEFSSNRRIQKATQSGVEVDYSSVLTTDVPVFFSFERRTGGQHQSNPYPQRDKQPPRGRKPHPKRKNQNQHKAKGKPHTQEAKPHTQEAKPHTQEAKPHTQEVKQEPKAAEWQPV